MGSSQLQHYLPQTYLKGFSTPTDEVWRFDRSSRTLKPLRPAVIGAENDLYSIVDANGISQNLESQWFSPLDSTFAPLLQKLQLAAELSAHEMYQLAMFTAYMRVRTPASIREAELRLRQIDSHLGVPRDSVRYHSKDPNPSGNREERFVLTKEQSEEIPTARGNACDRNDALQLLISTGKDLARALLNLDWTLLVAPNGRSFIAADSPFMTIPPALHDVDLEGVGPLTPGAITFMPLSASLCMRFANVEPQGLSRRQLDGAAVRSLNTCQVLNSERFVYSPSESLLRKLTASLHSDDLNLDVVVTREARSTSQPTRSLLHTFTRSNISSEWASRISIG